MFFSENKIQRIGVFSDEWAKLRDSNTHSSMFTLPSHVMWSGMVPIPTGSLLQMVLDREQSALPLSSVSTSMTSSEFWNSPG